MKKISKSTKAFIEKMQFSEYLPKAIKYYIYCAFDLNQKPTVLLLLSHL